jgi:hypothetical protein
MEIKLWLIQLALAVLPTLLRWVSGLAAAMAHAIEQLKAGAATSTVGQAPSGSRPAWFNENKTEAGEPIEELVTKLKATPNVCRHCGATTGLLPDPSAYYVDAVDEQGGSLLCADCQSKKEAFK